MLRAGVPGDGEIVDAAKPGMGGKGAKLVLAARYLTERGQRIRLQALQLAAVGVDNTRAATAAGGVRAMSGSRAVSAVPVSPNRAS